MAGWDFAFVNAKIQNIESAIIKLNKAIAEHAVSIEKFQAFLKKTRY